MTVNKTLKQWITQMADLLKPKEIVWIDGSRQQQQELIAQSLIEGELIELNQQLQPNCYLHRSHPDDVARVEGRTFIATSKKEAAGNINNWMELDQCKAKMNELYSGAMEGRTMYVIPFVMGPVGSDFSKVGVEITDSKYVVINMNIMAHVGIDALNQLGDSDDFTRCIHSLGSLNSEDRYICHYPEENTIASINSGYGGNALLGKKCLALRLASTMAKNEGWMAEHMLILGVEDPQGDISYIAAAFPSACGKTNLAMLIPPEGIASQGYKVWCVGDDIAWLRQGEDGRLWAVNPEAGFFGVAPGTSYKTNPNAMESTRKNTIFTNVALNSDTNTTWWEGMDKNKPENLLDWQGNPVTDDSVKAAHANSRFTSPVANCPCLSKEYQNPNGVPISAIVFGGRRAKLAPLVYQAYSWQHGVFIGSAMASETTAAASGKTGVTRRDPMAMLPFCGYDMGDYFSHWLDMGNKLGYNAPEIFHVNWFRTDDEGSFLWPGFGENIRVLQWILDRCKNKDEDTAVKTPIGYMPNLWDIDIEDLEITPDQMEELFSIDYDRWAVEIEDIRDYYKLIGKTVPHNLYIELDRVDISLRRRYSNSKKESVVARVKA